MHLLYLKQKPETKDNWGKSISVYPVDKGSFKTYKLDQLLGASRRNVGKEDTPIALGAEAQAKNYEKRKVVETFRSTENYEQCRLVMLSFLSNLEVCKIDSSIGMNLEEVRVGCHILKCFRKLMSRIQQPLVKIGI